jgi:hypothetical protein
MASVDVRAAQATSIASPLLERGLHASAAMKTLGTDAHDVGWARVGDGGLGGGAAGRAGRRERGRLGDPGADGVTVDCTGGNKSFVTFPIRAAKNY